ncbi:hypothetical protein [Microbacterium algeriense]|uniref:GAF domain-containing protein n=1 Tax=Microbacterium algeriense TaxID=2615184 RepID=A0ABQ6VAT0_9MICO|nr:hypothetical protein [Microbacterium algeriense]KAB1867351.1 hypothetical protein F6A08_06070 [Microbacterium algeriense]
MRDWKHATVDRVARAVLWFFRLVKGWLPRALGGLSSGLFIVWGVQDGAWNKGVGWFVAGLACAVLAFIAEFLVQRPSYMKLSQLREEAERRAANKSLALESALRIMLVRLSKHCGLEGHSDRFSVYYFHEDRFFMVSRYAKNPTYEARGRDSYPAAEGAIGAAWSAEDGQALVSMPAAKEAWKKAAHRQGISEDAIAGMSMKSRGLAGHRLEAGDRSVGVIVVESMTSGRIKATHLDMIAASHIVAAIAELVAAFALMTPAGENATAGKKPVVSGKWEPVQPRVPIGPTPGP